MEAALQLIQLGSESETDALTLDYKKRIKVASDGGEGESKEMLG